MAGDARATVSWAAPGNDGGSAITRYVVVASPGGATIEVGAVSTSAALDGLTNGAAYTFVVHAENAAGRGPASSATAPVTPRGAPGSPTGISGVASDQQVSLSWTAPADDGGSPITQYRVTATPGDAVLTVEGATATIVTGLTNGTAYTFSIVAQNAVGDSAPAVSEAFTPGAPPSAPTQVVGVRGDRQVTVSWTAPADEGTTPIIDYQVTSSPGGAVTTVAAPANSAEVTGLTNGQPYTFVVRARNSVGMGAASEPSAELRPATTPAAPAQLGAAAVDSAVTLTWAAPADDGGEPVTAYTLNVSPGGASMQVGAAQLQTTVTGLTNGTAYTFTVAATNAVGSGASSEISATPRTTPQPPTGVMATAGNAQATVSWTPPSDGGAPLTRYRIEASPGQAGTVVSAPASSAIVSGLTNGVAYQFRVYAENVAGEGTPSDWSAPVTPATVPSAPQAVSASGGKGEATVSWSPPADDGGSAVVGYTVTSEPATTARTVSAPTTTLLFTGLSERTQYTFQVRAANAVGVGAASAPSNLVASCAASACQVGIDSRCGADGTVITCSADTIGCGEFATSGGVACGANQSCAQSGDSAACACEDTCSAGDVAAGQTSSPYCVDTTTTGTCSVDADGCYIRSNEETCQGADVCQGPPGAAACGCAIVAGEPIEGGGCGTLGEVACGGDAILTCSTAGDGCQVWTATTDCASSGFSCGTSSGAPACQCPEPADGRFYVDASAGSPVGAAPYASGALEPAACRFNKLGPAFAAANSRGPGSRVILSGYSGAPVVFAGEALPLSLGADVTLTTADDPALGGAGFEPTRYVLAYDSGATSAIVLAQGARLAGFTVSSTAAAYQFGWAVTTACTGTAPITLEQLRLENAPGGSGFGGLWVNGCTVSAQRLEAQGFRGNGGGVRSRPAPGAFTCVDCSFSGNGTAVSAQQGSTRLENVTVSAAQYQGISASTGSDLVIDRGVLSGSQGSGITITGGTTRITHMDVGNVGSGASNSWRGISVESGTVVLDGVDVFQISGSALQVGPAGNVTVRSDARPTRFRSNNISGVSMFGSGVLDGTGFESSANGDSAINIGGNARAVVRDVTLTSSYMGANISSPTAYLTIEGASTITANRNNGIRILNGNVTVRSSASGAPVISNNPAGGIVLSNSNRAPTPLTVDGAILRGNGGDAVFLDSNNNGNQQGLPVVIRNSLFENATRNGIYMLDSYPHPSGPTVRIEGNTFVGGVHAIHFDGPFRTTTRISGNILRGASDTALVIDGTDASRLEITDNQIFDNGGATDTTVRGPVGGIVFYDEQPGTEPIWEGSFLFARNRIWSNAGDQVYVGAASGADWNLDPGSCAEANVFTCYDRGAATGKVGLVASSGGNWATMNASHNAFANDPPASEVDYFLYPSTFINLSATCPPVTLPCPAP